MYLTEDEAKQKWCPEARTVFSDGDGAINRTILGYGDDEGWRCLASECMAWRWQPAKTARPKWGYCGAFGKPDHD